MIMAEVYPAHYHYPGTDHAAANFGPASNATTNQPMPSGQNDDMDMLKANNPDKKTRFAPGPTTSPGNQQSFNHSTMYNGNNAMSGGPQQQQQQQNQNNMVAMAAMLGQMQQQQQQQQQAGQTAGYNQLMNQAAINGVGINTALAAGVNGYGQHVESLFPPFLRCHVLLAFMLRLFNLSY
jgi:hypothetical protein